MAKIYGITTGTPIKPQSVIEKTNITEQINQLSREIGDLSQLSQYGSSVTEILLKLIACGNITPSEKEILEAYNIFVPSDVSNEWVASGDGKTLNVNTSEFLELFYDGFVENSPSGVTVTKSSIGKDQSGLYDMWEYDFKPKYYSRTILLSSGMHTYELSASFGLANFIVNLYTDTENEAFKYIRENVRIKVIPVVNPWGFNQSPKKYGNINGVNPNRNFDNENEWIGFPSYTPSQNEWNVKGEKPFTEAETVNLANWCIDNYNAEFWIDCHTGLGYGDKDLWVYYSSDSVILDRINSAITNIETWFKETYGSDCVTTRTIDSEGSIRLRFAENICGVAGFTLEQAPLRTTFGTVDNNDSGDISNYSTNISTFVQEFLLEKYRDDTVIPITSASINNITIGYDELSKTVEATITPTDTTQNHFKWTSSDENVVKVYGGTNKAILVNMGSGNATISLVNRYNSSIKASFEVTVQNQEIVPDEPIVQTQIGAGVRGIDSNFGHTTEASNRITTDLIDVSSYSSVDVSVNNSSYCVKGFAYYENKFFVVGQPDGQNFPNSLGDFTTNTFTKALPTNTKYIRLLLKKNDGSDITVEEMKSLIITMNGNNYPFVETDEELVYEIGANIKGISSSTGELVENSARIITEMISLSNPPKTNCAVTISQGYHIKAFYWDYNKTYSSEIAEGSLNTSQINLQKWSNAYARILFKKSDNSDFTQEELLGITGTIDGVPFKLKLDESI